MDAIGRRSNAWNNALHAEGTRTIFEARANELLRKIRIRDFSGFALPIIVAYLLGSEVFAPLKPYREYAVGLLGVAALLQLLTVLWSVMARWDEELAYAMRASRDSYELREAWRKIGLDDVADAEVEYTLLSRQQAVVDSHDIGKSITPKEKQRGMRAGLIEFQRACVCGQSPRTRSIPWRKKIKECQICGGN